MKKAKDFLKKYNSMEEWKEVVYELMNGSYDLDKYPMQESAFIKDEFEEGSFCEQAYRNVYESCQRLKRCLSEIEYDELEVIIMNLQAIGRHLSMKMYDYGEMFGEKTRPRLRKIWM